MTFLTNCSFSKINVAIGILLFILSLAYFSVTFNILAPSSSVVLRESNDEKYSIDLWFMSIKDHTAGHITYAKQAILSARDNTDLIPIIILDGKDENLEKWMKKQNVLVVHVEDHPVMKYLRDADLMESAYQGIATWQRIVIPYIIKQMTMPQHSRILTGNSSIINSVNVTNINNSTRSVSNSNNSSFSSSGSSIPKAPVVPEKRAHPFIALPSIYSNRTIRAEYALYTDADVMFVNHFKMDRRHLPRYIGMAIQGDRYRYGGKFEKQMHSNAGVLVMNVTGYAEVYDEFIDYIKKHEHYIGENALDQAALQGFFPQRLTHLTLFDYLELVLYHGHYYHTLTSKYHSDTLPKVFEWEPYIGYNPDAIVIHWHGIKYYTDESLCPGPGKDFDFSMVPAVDKRNIRSYLNLTNPTAEELKGWNILLRYDFKAAKEGYSKYSDIYLKYIRKVCESNNVGLKQKTRW